MLGANGVLITKHYLPRWMAGDPPQTLAESLQAGEILRTQVGIFGDGDYRVGRSWMIAQSFGKPVELRSLTQISRLNLPAAISVVLPLPVTLEMRVRFENPRHPDQLDIQFHGLPVPLIVHGEHYAPDDFACAWRLGHLKGSYVLPPEPLSFVSDVVRPFNRLPGLYEGMSWQMPVFDPLSQLMPGSGRRPGMETVLVSVTGVEERSHPLTGATVSTFVVEAPQMRAWVAADGEVLIQEVDVPLVGRLRLVVEAFDEALFDEVAATSWRHEEWE